MAIIKFKRRALGGAIGAPSSLKTTEPAFNESDSTLYLGIGDDGNGNATSIIPVAGTGAFVARTGDQSVGGVKTFSDSPIIPTVTATDESTKAASTAYVIAKIEAEAPTLNVGSATKLETGRNISATGDISWSVSSFDGTADATATATLANSGITAGTYTKVTVDSKGRATAGATLAAADIPTLEASKISDFDTQVRTSRLDQMAVPTASVSLNGQKITGLADPTAGQDAATKVYVDSVAQGLDVKDSVVVATTEDITLSGEQTVDGVAVVSGARILVKDQATAAQNGIYVVAAGAWSRAAGADSWNALVSAFVFVEQGTVNKDSGWVCTVDSGNTLETDDISWSQFSGAGQIAAGDGLVKTGNVLAAVGTADRITVNPDSIDIAATYAGQASITTLGTVTIGTWEGTTISVAKGGTGLSSVLNGMVKGDGNVYSTAQAGVDYLAPDSVIDGGSF